MGHTIPLWISTCLIALHSALFGAALCVLGPFLPENFAGSIIKDIPLDTLDQSAAIALLLLACVPGSLLTGPAIDRFGNRQVLIFNGLLWLIGGIFTLFSSVPTLLIGRFILGLATGIASVIPPTLLNEIEPSDLKGTIANCHQMFICGAQLILYLLITAFVNVSGGWKWINGGTFVFFGTFAFLTGFMIPESPSWLLKNGREGECLSTLRMLRVGTLRDFWNKGKSDISGFANDPTAVLTGLRGNNQKSSQWNSDGDSNDDAVVATHQVFYGEEDQITAPTQYTTTSDNYDFNNQAQYNDNVPTSINTTNPNASTRATIINPALPSGKSNVQEVAVGMNADDPVFTELQQLKNNLSGGRESKWSDLLLPEYRLQLLIGIGLMAVQVMSGINSVASFATRLFGFAGLSETSAIWGTFALGLVGFVCTMGTALLLDILGRKVLILAGAGGCAISIFILAVSLLWMDSISFQGLFSLIITLVFIGAFQMIGGPIWLSVAEVTSSNIRSKAMSVYCTVNWSLNFLVVFATLPLMTLLGGGDSTAELKRGAGWLFIGFAVICCGSFAFAYFFMIETGGKTEDEIQTLLGARDDVSNDSAPMMKSSTNLDSSESIDF